MDIQDANHDADLSAFAVRNRREIARILRELIDRHVLVSVEGAAGGRFLSTFFDFDEDDELAYLECKDGVGGGSLHDAEAVTRQDGIEIRVPLDGAQRVRHGGGEAYRLSLPSLIYRVQRRQSFRMPLAQVKSAKCFFRLEDGEVETFVLDISLTGLGLRLDRSESPFALGQRIERCRLHLPDYGDHYVTLIIRNNFRITLKNEQVIYRVGCEFESLPTKTERDVQTLLFKLEAERRAKGV